MNVSARVADSPCKSVDSAVLEEAANLFESMKESLLADDSYRDKYVALKAGELVDMDADEFTLVERVHREYPDALVFIGHVTRENPVFEMPSPEAAA